MLALMTLAREQADIINSFKRSIRATPEVMSGYYVIGDVDFLLVITAEGMETYEQFSRDFFYRNPDIRRQKRWW